MARWLPIVAPTPPQFDPIDAVPLRVWGALVVFFLGLVLAFLAGRVTRQILVRIGVPGYIEGTAFERTARDLDTSTVNIVARLVSLSVLGIVVLAALSVAEVNYADRFWNGVVGFLPQLFVAVVILIVGVVIGDKVALLVAERLRGVKLPQTGVVPTAAKYTVFFIAAVIALSQVGVATLALHVLLGVYLVALVVFGAIAGRDLLASATAGTYLLLYQPYSIGDEIRVDDTTGIVQEVGLVVTHVETEGEEHVVPNRLVFQHGVVRIRS